MNSVSNIIINYNVISLIETLVEAMFKIPNVINLTATIFCWVKNLSMSDFYNCIQLLQDTKDTINLLFNSTCTLFEGFPQQLITSYHR